MYEMWILLYYIEALIRANFCVSKKVNYFVEVVEYSQNSECFRRDDVIEGWQGGNEEFFFVPASCSYQINRLGARDIVV